MPRLQAGRVETEFFSKTRFLDVDFWMLVVRARDLSRARAAPDALSSVVPDGGGKILWVSGLFDRSGAACDHAVGSPGGTSMSESVSIEIPREILHITA